MLNAIVMAMVFSVTSKELPPTIQEAHRVIVDNWIQTHPGFRIATEKDCKGCEEQIRSIRNDTIGVWKPVPNYQPYYAVGDFNNDGNDDFSIVMISAKKSSKRFIVLVFNGPFKDSATPGPAFVSESMNLASKGLFFGPPRPKPYRLIIGPFESEGIMLLPKGNGYSLER